VLPYECGSVPGAAPPLLAYACVDDFRLNLDVGPDTMEVGARLGNIVATYEVCLVERLLEICVLNLVLRIRFTP
jgi:hypothetical protein